MATCVQNILRGCKSGNQSVSGVTTICLTQCNTSPSHRVDQVVDCGMLVHSSSIAVRSCWILAGTGIRCRSRASQTCSMGDMSGEYAGHARTGTFSTSRNCVQILATSFFTKKNSSCLIQNNQIHNSQKQSIK